jgi:gliding motility-associated-like protein
MNFKPVTIAFLLLCFMSANAEYAVKGGKGAPLLIATEPSSGLNVYMLNGLTDAEITFTSKNEGQHLWFKYSTDAATAVPVACTQVGNASTITNLEDGYGYFVTDPETVWYYVWIVDFIKCRPKIYDFKLEDNEYECDYINLAADAEAEPVKYNLPSGVTKTVPRKYVLQYDDLQWNEDAKQFEINTISETISDLFKIMLAKPPLTDTQFILTGDEFAIHFEESESMSVNYAAIAVEAHATAETDRIFSDTEIHNVGTNLGGSAPVEYTFTAYANEPVAAQYTWRLFKIENDGTRNSVVIYKGNSITYNFTEEGNFIMKLEVSNLYSTCADTSKVFNITVGETYLKIPNVFSPGSSIGTNDEFKVSYRSLTSFRATIFNRWGNILYRWSDPAKGWDGKVNGKYVPTGVYYVIVEYTDATGKKRTESKDINILREID